MLFNAAAVAADGAIRGIVPKCVLPNYREFYEKRHFHSGRGITDATACIGGREVPFGADLIFDGGAGFRFGIEICEDLWCVLPPSLYLALGGARAVFNLSAGNELAGKADYRRELVTQQSARCLAAYVLAGAGVHESTTDLVFGGHAIIADNGRLAAENRRFDRESSLTYADVDFERLGAARLSESSFNDNPLPEGMRFRRSGCRRRQVLRISGTPRFRVIRLCRRTQPAAGSAAGKSSISSVRGSPSGSSIRGRRRW